MLQSYSWSEYLSGMGIIAAGYYLVIGGLYYRSEIKQILSGKTKINLNKIMGNRNGSVGADEQEAMDELEFVAGSLKRSVLEQAGAGISKEQLLMQIKLRLANYHGLRQPAFRVALNNFIVQNSNEICGVSFSENELNAAWETLPR